jgi:hypothetical protein
MLAILPLLLAAAAFVPPVIKEPPAPPAAWFVEDLTHDRWCQFGSRKRAEAFAASFGTSGPETPGAAWVRLANGKLDSVTVQSTSDDAFTEDRYFFAPDGQVAELRRTAAYAQDKPATYVFKLDPTGKLAATPQTKALVKRLDGLHYTTYYLDWDKYHRFAELPFAGLIAIKDGKATIKTGCTAPLKTQNKRR